MTSNSAKQGGRGIATIEIYDTCRVHLLAKRIKRSHRLIDHAPSYSTSPTAPRLPGLPADCHAANMRLATSSTPLPSFTLQKMVGPSPLMSFESRSMISSDAFTYCAISVWRDTKST